MNPKWIIATGIILALWMAFHFVQLSSSGTIAEAEVPGAAKGEVATITPAPDQPSQTAGTKEVSMTSIAAVIQDHIDKMQGIMAVSVGNGTEKTISDLDVLLKEAQGNAKDALLLDVDPAMEDTRFTLSSSAAHLAMAIFEYKDSLITRKASGKINNAQIDASGRDLKKAKEELREVTEKLK